VTSASPAFQGDRPGSPGFQLFEHGGFQTLGPVIAGTAGLGVGASARVVFHPVGAYVHVGDARVVIGASAVVTFTPAPVVPQVPLGGAVWTLPRRRAVVTGGAGVTVGASARVSFWSFASDDEEVLLRMAAATGNYHALLLALIEEDDRLRRRRDPGSAP
jgi:hypothetical protein